MDQKDQDQSQTQVNAPLDKGIKGAKYRCQDLKDSQRNTHYCRYFLLPRPIRPENLPGVRLHQFVSYSYFLLPLFMAAQRLSGVTGVSKNRQPVALARALQIAGAVGIRAGSPTPFAP